MDGKLDAAQALCTAESTPVARMIEKGITRIGKPLGDITQGDRKPRKTEVTRLEKGCPYARNHFRWSTYDRFLRNRYWYDFDL